MMKKFLSLIFIAAAAINVNGMEKSDTTYWTKKGISGININQVSLSNWAAGGESSVALDLMLNYSADYKKDRHLWQNRLELAYGLNYTSSNSTRKTNDKIYLSSNYGYKISKHWYLSMLLTFQTQFANGYDYSPTPKRFLSQFMSPGYLTIGPGFTWIPNKWFTMTVSPATWRGTFVLNKTLSDQGAFGVKPGKHLFSQFGGNLNAEINYEILPNMTLITRLNLFSDYLNKPQNIVVNWDLLLNMKINKWFSANFILNTIYDDNVHIPNKANTKSVPRFQIKESLGVGLTATF